jgi:hypothetical protein
MAFRKSYSLETIPSLESSDRVVASLLRNINLTLLCDFCYIILLHHFLLSLLRNINICLQDFFIRLPSFFYSLAFSLSQSNSLYAE